MTAIRLFKTRTTHHQCTDGPRSTHSCAPTIERASRTTPPSMGALTDRGVGAPAVSPRPVVGVVGPRPRRACCPSSRVRPREWRFRRRRPPKGHPRGCIRGGDSVWRSPAVVRAHGGGLGSRRRHRGRAPRRQTQTRTGRLKKKLKNHKCLPLCSRVHAAPLHLSLCNAPPLAASFLLFTPPLPAVWHARGARRTMPPVRRCSGSVAAPPALPPSSRRDKSTARRQRSGLHALPAARRWRPTSQSSRRRRRCHWT